MELRTRTLLLLVLVASVSATPVEKSQHEEGTELEDTTQKDIETSTPLDTITAAEEDLNNDDLGKADKQENVKVDYTGAQVWNVATNKTGVRALLSRMRRRHLISTWGGNQSSVDILVYSNALDNVTRIFKKEKILYEIIIDDLQERINRENPPLDDEELQLQDRRGHRMTWKQYHRLDDIYGFLDYLSKTYPSLITVRNVGKSHEGRDIKVLKLSNGNTNNKAIFIDGGIHAREWISPSTVTFFINQFAENFDVESDDIKNIDWYFIPVLNPDGYEFTHTVDRMWRKNRKPAGITRICSGTDLNRNFGYKWGGKGSSSNPCSEIYGGKGPFSEPESKAMSDFIKTSGANFTAYLTYHSYGQYILYPWGYDNLLPPDYKELDRVGKNMAKAIEQTRSTRYKVGSSSNLLYPAAGGSDDWAKAIGIKYAYTIELSDTGRNGFVLPTEYIVPVAMESLAGLRALVKEIHNE